MEEKRDAMDKLVAAAYEYADERITDVQYIYRKKAEKMVEEINKYRRWAKDDVSDEQESRELNERASGIEQALIGLGFVVGYNFMTGKSYLA